MNNILPNILKARNELKLKEENLRQEMDANYDAYDKYVKSSIDKVTTTLEMIGLWYFGYCNSSSGPFKCSTIVKYQDQKKNIIVYYNVNERSEEFRTNYFGTVHPTFKYKSNNDVVELVMKDNDCFLIKDMRNMKCYSCSSLNEVKNLVERLY